MRSNAHNDTRTRTWQPLRLNVHIYIYQYIYGICPYIHVYLSVSAVGAKGNLNSGAVP